MYERFISRLTPAIAWRLHFPHLLLLVAIVVVAVVVVLVAVVVRRYLYTRVSLAIPRVHGFPQG